MAWLDALAAALALELIALQCFLFRRFRRDLHPLVAGATLAALVLAVTAGTVLSQHDRSLTALIAINQTAFDHVRIDDGIGGLDHTIPPGPSPVSRSSCSPCSASADGSPNTGRPPWSATRRR